MAAAGVASTVIVVTMVLAMTAMKRTMFSTFPRILVTVCISRSSNLVSRGSDSDDVAWAKPMAVFISSHRLVCSNCDYTFSFLITAKVLWFSYGLDRYMNPYREAPPREYSITTIKVLWLIVTLQVFRKCKYQSLADSRNNTNPQTS